MPAAPTYYYTAPPQQPYQVLPFPSAPLLMQPPMQPPTFTFAPPGYVLQQFPFQQQMAPRAPQSFGSEAFFGPPGVPPHPALPGPAVQLQQAPPTHGGHAASYGAPSGELRRPDYPQHLPSNLVGLLRVDYDADDPPGPRKNFRQDGETGPPASGLPRAPPAAPARLPRDPRDRELKTLQETIYRSVLKVREGSGWEEGGLVWGVEHTCEDQPCLSDHTFLPARLFPTPPPRA